MLFSIGSHKWIRLLLLTFALYIVFLPVWLYVLGVLAGFAGAASNWIYGFFDPRVSIRADGRVVGVFITGIESQATSSGLRLDTVTYGMPLLAALVIATSSQSRLAKVKAILLGLAVMAALTVPAVMAWAKLATLQAEERISSGNGDRSSFLFYAFHGYAFSQPAIAVAVWLGLMMLGTLKQEKNRGQAPTARNAPCPCGSGRKYKRCCGRG